jgi:hypothetical protein
MRHFIGSMVVLLFMTSTSQVLYGQDLGYQPPTSSWGERLKEAFFPGFQPSKDDLPGAALMGPSQQRNIFEDGFVAAQRDGRIAVETPVGNVFNLRF